MRGVWIAACVIGIVVFGGLAVMMGYVAYLSAEAGASLGGRAILWPIGLLLAAGACAAGIFLTPREMQGLMTPDPDPEPAEWVKTLRSKGDAASNADRSDTP
jgi:hypothetical protein